MSEINANPPPARGMSTAAKIGLGVGISILAAVCCLCLFMLAPYFGFNIMPPSKYSGYGSASHAAWTANGNQIVAELSDEAGFNGMGIYVMNIDGSNVRHLTHNVWTWESNHPVPSPDGRYLP